MNDKDIKINLMGFQELDEQILGMLIDSLVELYQEKYGLDISIDEPDKPEYDAENLDIAKNYLKKFRLQ